MVKKKVSKPKKEKKTEPLPDKNNTEVDDRFEMGGLPKMNLKKNLGCG